MNENNYTSLELSKKLTNGGCDYSKPSKFWQVKGKEINLVDKMYNHPLVDNYYPAYDILWDICIKYSKEFFGEVQGKLTIHPINILGYIRQGEKQEAEDYIWEHCKFNN